MPTVATTPIILTKTATVTATADVANNNQEQQGIQFRGATSLCEEGHSTGGVWFVGLLEEKKKWNVLVAFDEFFSPHHNFSFSLPF